MKSVSRLSLLLLIMLSLGCATTGSYSEPSPKTSSLVVCKSFFDITSWPGNQQPFVIRKHYKTINLIFRNANTNEEITMVSSDGSGMLYHTQLPSGNYYLWAIKLKLDWGGQGTDGYSSWITVGFQTKRSFTIRDGIVNNLGVISATTDIGNKKYTPSNGVDYPEVKKNFTDLHPNSGWVTAQWDQVKFN